MSDKKVTCLNNTYACGLFCPYPSFFTFHRKIFLKQSLYVLYSPFLCLSVFTSITHPGNPESLQPLSDLNDRVFWFWHGRFASGLPGVDQVLGQADAGMRASYGDLSVGRAFHRVGNLDLSAWHLADLIDLCALAANDAANELPRRKERAWVKATVLKNTTNTTITSKNNNNTNNWMFSWKYGKSVHMLI